MRLRLDDNERGAFHYLALGVATVAVVRGAAWALSFLGPTLSPDMALLAELQQGYPALRGHFAVVATDAGLTERLMQAVVLAVGLALVSAVAQAIPAWRQRRLPGRTGTLITRMLLLGAMAWGTYAALFLPLRRSDVVDGRLRIMERPRAFGEIPWPVPATERFLGGADQVRLEPAMTRAHGSRQGEEALLAITAKDTLELARRTGIQAEAELKGLRDASAAAAILERELNTGY